MIVVARWWVGAAFCIWAASPALTLAQEDPEYLLTQKQTKEETDEPCKCAEEEEPEEEPSNWDFVLDFGSQFQLSQNRGVVGVQNGGTRSIGGQVHAEANWARNKHEVRNRADINAVFINTPNTKTWLSASDLLELETIYQYRARPWVGPFARVGMTTSMFPGRDLRANTVDYQIDNEPIIPDLTDIRLTDPFKPLTLLQSVGVFFNPVREEQYNFDIRTGVGAREVFAEGQLGLDDNNSTPSVVELTRLRDFAQVGWELIASLKGELFDQKLSYYVVSEILFPLYFTREAGETRNRAELIDKIFRFGVAYRIASWATLLYEFRIVHQPLIIDRYQMQHGLGFQASYSVF